MRDPSPREIGSLLSGLLGVRLERNARAWLDAARGEVAAGAGGERLPILLSLASRRARGPLAPSPEELAQAERLLPGWCPERWALLDAVRVALLLAVPGLERADFAGAFEECFRYADEGEQCSLYRALPLLPAGERFAWRAGEGCRSNLQSVFEAVACDSPYPVRQLDELTWRQLVIKAVFIGAPLSRVYGLERRLSPELARMALDLVDERRAAGRPVPPDLWRCLGTHAGERGLRALREETAASDPACRSAAVSALRQTG